jgi:hypothetical protein
MNKLVKMILVGAVFISSLIIASYIEEYFRKCVRYFFMLFQGSHIEFFGKNFRLFASEYFIAAFGLFCVLLTILILKTDKKRIWGKMLLTIFLFFLTTSLTSYVDSSIKVKDCTICKENKRELNYNNINYDWHFIVSLTIALLPLSLGILKNRRQEAATK